MYRSQFVLAGLTVALVGLTSCGQASTSGGDQSQQAGQQFLNERGGTTTAGASGQGASAAPQDAPVMGMVAQLDGEKLLVKDPFNNSTTTVLLASDVKFKKQVPGKPADLKPGDKFMSFGMRKGDTFEPEALDIGLVIGGPAMSFSNEGPGGAAGNTTNQAVPGPGGAPASGPTGAGSTGTGPVMGQGGDMPGPISGTIESVDGNKITVKTSDGQTLSMVLTDKVQIHVQADAQRDEFKTGKMILAEVTRNGQEIKASQVNLLPEPPQP